MQNRRRKKTNMFQLEKKPQKKKIALFIENHAV